MLQSGSPAFANVQDAVRFQRGFGGEVMDSMQAEPTAAQDDRVGKAGVPEFGNSGGRPVGWEYPGSGSPLGRTSSPAPCM